MSTWSDLCCVECDERFGFVEWKAPSATPQLLELIKHRSWFEECPDIDWPWMLRDPEIERLVAYFKKHKGHSIRMRNGYGGFDGTCDRLLNCGGELGHAGDCLFGEQP